MEKFPAKFSKILQSPDPQYMPGYTGYCPQLKYHHGITYGKLTAKLLSSPEVSRSRRFVLHTGRFPSTEVDTGPRDYIWRSRCGDHRYFERMIPGYTGFVPRCQNYFSRTYAETCREALSDFDNDQQTLKRMTAQSGQSSDKHALLKPKPCKTHTSVSPICKGCAYKPLDPSKSFGSPYFMEEGNPYKYFISGFTGYVPKSRFFIGECYPLITNKALIQFNKDMKSMKSDGSSTQDSPNYTDSLPAIANIYHSQQGLLPLYTGHVPGYKFKYGQTFGQLTHNTLDLSDVQKKIEAN